MGSPCFRIALDHRRVRCCVVELELKLRLRGLGLVSELKLNILFIATGPVGIHVGDAVNRVLNPDTSIFVNSFAFREITENTSVVYFRNLVFDHQLPEGVTCVFCFSEEDDTRRLPVEPMHCLDGTTTLRLLFTSCLVFLLGFNSVNVAHLVLQNTLEGVQFEIATSMHWHRTGLIDNEV